MSYLELGDDQTLEMEHNCVSVSSSKTSERMKAAECIEGKAFICERPGPDDPYGST